MSRNAVALAGIASDFVVVADPHEEVIEAVAVHIAGVAHAGAGFVIAVLFDPARTSSTEPRPMVLATQPNGGMAMTLDPALAHGI